MPFIEQWRRDTITKQGLEGLAVVQPGDRCYVFYKKLVGAWREAPQWTTAHNLLVATLEDDPGSVHDAAAKILTWEVFFNLHVMPYEMQKREQNGDV